MKMYVEDVAGISENDPIGRTGLQTYFPQRRVKRAIWLIHYKGCCTKINK